MLGDEKVVSPSRTYVAICYRGNFDGHYMRKFTLPETMEQVPAHARDLYHVHEIVKDGKTPVTGRNDAAIASWYFLNVCDRSAGLEGVITFEDYSNIDDQADVDKRLEEAVKKACAA